MTLAELEQESSPDASDGMEDLDRAAQEYACTIQAGVRPFLGSSRSFDEGCKLIWKEVLADRTSQVHEARDRYLAAFRHRLTLLQKASRLARHAGQLAGTELPEAKLLETEAEVLGRKLDRLAVRWQTSDDLEDLAADGIELPPGKLDAVRRKYAPAQAWYDQDGESSRGHHP
jgi:hypothetical protein